VKNSRFRVRAVFSGRRDSHRYFQGDSQPLPVKKRLFSKGKIGLLANENKREQL
jgi:hypothetical protein